MSNDLELKLSLRATDDGLVGVVSEVTDHTEKLNKTFDETQDAAKAAGKGQDNLSESLDKTGKQADQSGKEVKQLNDKLDKHSGKAKKAAKESGNFSKKLKDGAITAAKWGAGLAAATVTAGAFAVVLNTEAIRETDVLAQTLNISTQALTEWEYAAGQVNVSGEKVGDIFKDVSDKIGDFVTTGGGEAADLFENLNLKAEELIDLAPDQQLLKIGDALENVNRNQQVFFLESLADDASRLLPLLENDAEVLQRLQLEAQVLGVSLSDIDAGKVTLAAQAFDRVKGLGKGIVNDLTVEMAPVLSGIANQFVDAAVEAGGFRGAIKTAIDYTVSGVGFVLDYMQQLRILLKLSEQGWLMIGEAGTGALASIADTTANVINTVMYPFQKSIAWVIEKYSYLLDLGSEFGGPFADEFKTAAAGLKGFSAELDQFSVSADDIVDLNKSVSASLAESTAELEALIAADAPSDVLKATIAELREEAEKLAAGQDKVGKKTKETTNIVTDQKDEYKDLVKSLEDELKLLGLSELERREEINIRKLSANATDQQKQKVRELTGQIYAFEQAAKKSEEAAKPWSDAWDASTKRIDEVFANAWTGAFDGFESFSDALVDSFKQTLAEMAHLAFTKKIVVNVTTALGESFGIPGLAKSESGTEKTLNAVSTGSGVLNAAKSADTLFSSISQGWASDGFTGAISAGFKSIGSSLGLTSSASSSAAAGSAAGASGGLATAAPWIAGGIAVASLLSGAFKGETRSGQQLAYDASGLRITEGPSGGPIAEQDVNTAVTGMINSLETMLATFGSTASVGSLEAKLETSGKGRGGVYVGGALSTGEQFGEFEFEQYSNKSPNAEQAVALFIEDLQQGMIQGLQAANLDGHVGEYLSSLGNVEEITGDQLAGIVQHLDGLTAITATLESGSQVAALLPDSIEKTLAVIEQMKLDGETITDTYGRLSAQANFFYQNFYSEHEKAAVVVDSYSAIINDFNTEFDTAIQSKEDLRAFVDELDRTSESGQKAYIAALELAPVLLGLEEAMQLTTAAAEEQRKQQAQITQSELAALERDKTNAKNTLVNSLENEISTLVNAQQQLVSNAETARNNLVSAYQRSIEKATSAQSQLESNFAAAKSGYEDAINRQIERQSTLRDNALELAETWRTVADQLADSRSSIVRGALSGSNAQAYDQQQFNSLIQQAWNGELSAFEQLPGAAQNYQNTLRSQTASGAEFRLLSAEIAAQLQSVESHAGSRETEQQRIAAASERTVKSLERQLESIQGVERAILSIAEAREAYESAQAALENSSHAQSIFYYNAQVSRLQNVSAGIQSLTEAQATYADASAALEASNHAESLTLLNAELDELKDTKKSIADLDAARAEYERASMALVEANHRSELSVLQSQLQTLESINNGQSTLAASLAERVALPKFSNGGIASGPTSGYAVELHGTEAVIPLKNGSVPVQLSGSGNSDALIRQLIAEVERLRQDTRAVNAEQTKASIRMASLMRRWDKMGLKTVNDK